MKNDKPRYNPPDNPVDREMMLEAAIGYARQSIPVFPLHTIREDGSCTCLGTHPNCRPGKHPTIKKFIERATTNEKQIIKSWRDEFPGANIGMPTGRDFGYWALDVDPRNGGAESLDNLIDEHGDLPPTKTIRTGSGGSHYLFSYSFDQKIRIPSKAKVYGLGLDTRGERGYVCAPPSLHKSLTRYENLRLGPLAATPEWLLEPFLEKPKLKRTNKYGRCLPPELYEGERNEALYNEACHLRDKGLGFDRIAFYIRLVNNMHCKPPLTDEEIVSIMSQAFKYRERPSWSPLRLCNGSRKVLRYIWSLSGQTGSCHPLRSDIAVVTELSKKQVTRNLKTLAERKKILLGKQGRHYEIKPLPPFTYEVFLD